MSPSRNLQRMLIAPLLWALLAGCSGHEEPDASSPGPAVAEAHQDVVEQVGDVTVHCSVVQTSLLPDTIARQYGVVRSPKTLLLLVAVRKGDPAVATSVPATVTATAAGLSGDKQTIEMHPMRSGDLVDSIGTLQTTLPDTLQFDVTVRADGVAPMHLNFQRDLYP